MNRQKVILLSAALVLFSWIALDVKAQSKQKPSKNAPVFTNVVYEGNDQVYKDYPLAPDEFYNPILQGCYPDPAITRKGDDYYMVCSSFALFPGVPMFDWHELGNWTQSGQV